MTKRSSCWAVALALLAVLSALALVSWKPLGMAVLRSSADRSFRHRHLPDRPPPQQDFYDADWAWRFGLVGGLSRLDAIADDPSVSPEGRAKATRIADGIRTGKYRDYVEELVHPQRGVVVWPTSEFVRHALNETEK